MDLTAEQIRSHNYRLPVVNHTIPSVFQMKRMTVIITEWDPVVRFGSLQTTLRCQPCPAPARLNECPLGQVRLACRAGRTVLTGGAAQTHPIAFHGQTGAATSHEKPGENSETDVMNYIHSPNEVWQIRWRVGMQDEFQTLKVSLYSWIDGDDT